VQIVAIKSLCRRANVEKVEARRRRVISSATIPSQSGAAHRFIHEQEERQAGPI